MTHGLIVTFAKIAIGTIGVAFLATFVLLVSNTFLPRYPYHETPDAFQMPYQEVRFQATDGKKLAGWIVLKDEDKPWIILCHGLGANKADILPFGDFLYRKGFNLFFFDFRGHGESSGLSTSFGYLEQRDLEGAVRFLNGKYPQGHLGVWGDSMGGSVAILVAARQKEIRAVCVDSPYHDLEGSISRHLSLIFRLPRIPFGYFARWAYELRFLTSVGDISPLNVIQKISPSAVFIINGERDPRMRAEEARALFDKAGQPKELWIVPEAGHLEAHSLAPQEYERKVSGFFQKYLLE